MPLIIDESDFAMTKANYKRYSEHFQYDIGDMVMICRTSNIGQIYELVAIDPYIRKDGKKSQIIRWQSYCPHCFKEFICTSALPIDRKLYRRCGECSDKGKKGKIRLSKSYKQNYSIPRASFFDPE
jgi:hypothetical protein